MGQLNQKKELINILLDSLPDLSNYINQIVILMPKNIEKLDLEHLETIQPKIQSLLDLIIMTTDKIKPSDSFSGDDHLIEIYDLYFHSITEILAGVENLNKYFLSEEEVPSEEMLEIAVEKLFEGSIGITKLVEKITE